jgi:hypothetical protein
MRLVLRVNDIDQRGYDSNGFQKTGINVVNSVGSSNVARSLLTFNLDLSTYFAEQKDFYTLKFVGIFAIMKGLSPDIIDRSSHPALRTSNLYCNGFTTINGETEILLGQYTNFNPNEELVFENVFFLTGNLANYEHYYDYNRTNAGGQTNDFYRFLWGQLTYFPTTSSSFARYRITSSSITQLNNKIVRGGRPARQPGNNDNFLMSVIDAGDGTTPARVTQANGTVTITVLPENNEWFMARYTDDVPFENYLELSILPPTDPSNVQLTFQLRDLLTNQLQPAVNVDEVFPSFNIVIDII